MDAAQKTALTNYDESTRRKAYATTQTLLANDAPIVVINWLRLEHPINDDFKGLDPNAIVEDWNAWQWSI
jgi:hypothetical protein